MRTIKFRGKRINRNGEWAYGDLRILSDRTLILPQASYDAAIDRDAVDESTIGQFTGLLDKNGKEIFEGDIIKIEEEGVVLKPKVVDFSNGMFGTREWSLAFYGEDIIEVIGNIHDNPELLKNND